MKRSWMMTILPALLLILIIGYATWRLIMPGETDQLYTVSVILSDSGNNRWRSFRQGLQQGSDEGNIILNVVSTSQLDSMSELAEIVRREISSNADGLIVAPCADDTNGILATALSSVPTVLTQTGISGQELFDTVAVDGYEMGRVIANLVLDNADNQEEATIGILSGNQETLVMQECLRGFRETLNRDEQILWTVSEKAQTSGELLNLSMTAKPVDILVALDNTAMESAIDYLTDHENITCELYGQGRSEQCIYYLDQGLISAMAVPDEFMMGYEAMNHLLQKLSNYSPAVTSQEIHILSVTKDNLHDTETASILFPTIS